MDTNCIKCNASMHDKPLHRTKPTGQPDPGWMCQSCMEIHEPELFSNLKKSGDLQISTDIFDAINPKAKQELNSLLKEAIEAFNFTKSVMESNGIFELSEGLAIGKIQSTVSKLEDALQEMNTVSTDSEIVSVNKLELASNLAHQAVIEGLEMKEEDLTNEKGNYKEEIQEYFNTLYDYYLTEIDKCTIK